MSTEGSRQRPYKVWSADRTIRKGITASNVQELVNKGKIKLSLQDCDVSVVLESDGTEIDDDRYFQSLEDNTVFVFLRIGEKWYPPGVEAIRADVPDSSLNSVLFQLKKLKKNFASVFMLSQNELQAIIDFDLNVISTEEKEELKRIQDLCKRNFFARHTLYETVELINYLQQKQNFDV